jgi:hypothetical protein
MRALFARPARRHEHLWYQHRGVADGVTVADTGAPRRPAGHHSEHIIKEYLSRGTHVFPPGLRCGSPRAVCSPRAAALNPMNVCSHLQGATPVELAMRRHRGHGADDAARATSTRRSWRGGRPHLVLRQCRAASSPDVQARGAR